MLEVYCGAMMLDEERCRRAVSEAFPKLPVRSARYFASGWDYELWEVNGELLFRFPLRAACVGPLRIEARLLPALAQHLSVPVPEPRYVTDGCPSFPLPFFGYRRLAGAPLSESTLDGRAELSLAEEAGRFLRGLHSFPVERAAVLGVPAYDGAGWRAWYTDFSRTVRTMLVPLLSPNVMAAVESFWQRLLDNDAFFAFQPVLIHRDFDDEHVLVQDGKLVGVIDFADACVGDPALDFAGREGAFRAQMLAAYGCSAEEAGRLSARADVYRQISPFHAVVYGMEINDAGWLRRGIEAIQNAIAKEVAT